MAPNFSPPPLCEKCPCGVLAGMCNCFEFLAPHRRAIFLTLFAVQFIAVVPAAIALVASARGRQLTFSCWAFEDVDGKNGYGDWNLYIGFRGAYTRGDVGREFLSWTELKDLVQSGKKDNVNDCKEAALSEISTAVTGLVTILPSLATLWTRAHEQFDTGCNKFIGVASGFGGGIMTLASLQTFVAKCFRQLPTTFRLDDGTVFGKGDKSHGPGLICEGLLVAVTLLCGLVHLIMPVPPQKPPLLDDDEKKKSEDNL
eukprot:CAMPEP_0198656598 /NCGR_PEP_ID=MMETSP1467-20131203/10252_1 /TAXON_ID=1462469 /ORGANISM="unid. sp., Strain CCMP2135" /LENGTH=256 /DNA_ID=CAMNT_0044392647 /DNA_START=35 /DNA_END=805 /DNA_ORIENTATION=+